MFKVGSNENGKECLVNVASVCDCVGGYRFGYDGYRVELSPVEALEFYNVIKLALNSTAADFTRVCIRVPSIEKYFKIRRVHLYEMWCFFQAEEVTGKAKWLN